MARNIEIKARLDHLETWISKAGELADSGPTRIIQDDTFFGCPNGRLKLRTFSAARGELIFYRRADCAGPKESIYAIAPTHEPELLREALTLAYGQIGRVRKTRHLFLAGRTRIHLDQVEGLGAFLELEVVLNDGESPEAGIAEANELLERLGIAREWLVEGAYVDQLPSQHTPSA